MYFVSVDCGGTKSAFLMTDEKGNQIATCKLGPGNYLVIGLDAMVKLINEGMDELCRLANVTRDDITMAVIASAGFSSGNRDSKYDERAKKEYKFNYFLTGDTNNAMKGSLLDNEGIHLIAGTGSVGKGFDGTNIKPAIGGWGYYCGSDEGGGYWIGAKLLWHYERQSDGREPKTMLHDYVANKYNFESDHDVIFFIIETLKNERDKIAALAVDVAELCKLGDPCALQIMKEAGYELGTIAKALYKRDGYKLPLTISYSGSVFKSLEYLKPGIEEALADIPHNIRKPILSPLAGGVLMAMNLANYKYDDEVIENLKKLDA